MTNWTRGILTGLAIFSGCLLGREAVAQATAVSLTGTSYTQNFDGMANTATAAVPQGWGFFRSGTATVTPAFTSGSTSTATTTTAGSAGTAPTAGGAYLWVTGTAASGTDKSIGFLSSGSYPGGTTASSLAILFGFTNNSGGTITSLDLAWDYEKYRSGTRAFDWNFFTSTDGTTWTANALGNQSYAADANSTTMSNPPLSAAKAVNLSSLNITAGSNYYVRWSFIGSGGWTNSQGLGIDNFVMNATVTGGAANGYWDGASGWSTTGPGVGGSGVWSDSVGAWNPADIATFGGTAGAVTTELVTASNGIVFAASGYTLSGGTISLAGSTIGLNSITTGTAAPFTATIGSVLAGSTGLTKLGPGTLILTGVNTFTGNISVGSGTLQVATDESLGDATNDISLAGTLATSASLTLGPGRDLTGGGVLDIAPGTTLTSSGSFGLASTTLANSGTLDLQGATRSVGVLTFNTAATVNASGPLSATGLTATGVTSGSAIVNSALTFSSGDKTTDVGSGGTLVLNGDIAGTTGRIGKTGLGTLIASGSNSTSGFRLGVAGASPTNGGTLILAAAAASGTGQLQLNFGTLQATAPFTFANGLSVGGRTGAVAVLGGTSAMTFSGSTSFFRGTATSGELRLDVNNATSLDGVIGPTSGGGTSTGITIGGTGALTINGNASALTDVVTIQDLLDLNVNGTLFTGTAGSLTAQIGTLLGGSGTIAGAVTMANGSTLAPGTSPGTLTIAGALGLGDTTSLLFELSATDQTVGGGINDLITGITNLTLDGVLNVTPIGDFSTVAAGAKWRLFNYSGTLTDQLLTLGSVPTLADGSSFAIDVATPGEVSLVVVPEPTAVALGGCGAMLAGFAAWRHRRRK
ncbi:MAG: beta strand repeat-containing protein [Planctomycetia bacterium]